MATIRIATTRQRDLQPLGTAGQTAIECWSVLSALLLRELGPSHAALFAEPVVNPAQGETDWYTEGEATPVPLTMLDPDARAAVQAERMRLEQDMRSLAARRRAASGEGERFLADMLMLALSVPGDDHVYAVDGRPVLVAWGHASAGGAPEQVVLTGLRQGSPVPMTILPPPVLPVAASRIRRWLMPALLASLLLPLLALLLLWFDPFGWYLVGRAQCRVAAGEPALLNELHDAADREAQLRAQLAQVTDDAGRRHLQCPPIQVPAPVAPAAAPSVPDAAPPSQDVQRATQRGAHGGKLQVILAWEDRNDLDLHVICPDGQEIQYSNKVACGGHLDVDANGTASSADSSPVENVYFDSPAPGTYKVVVNPFAMRVGPDSNFRVTIRREGEPDQITTGTAHNGAYNQIATQVEVAP
jgi:hypothetical protein